MVAEFGGILLDIDGKQGVPAGAGRQLGDRFGHVVDGILLDGLAALRAVGGAGAGEQQAEEVIDLGRGGHRRAGVAGGVLLTDGDRRGKTEDFIDVGLLHAVEELPGVGRERFDVATLAFSVDGVEDERGLAGAGHAGDDGELIVRDTERDILEVVHPRAADVNELVDFRFPFFASQ